MKNKLIATIILFLSFHLQGQLKTFGLSKSGCQLFNGHLYVYGIQPNATFCVYKLDLKLAVLDSVCVMAGKAEDYLQGWSDTLHGFLNIYLQRKEKKALSILRFTKTFERVATIENVEISRLNNTSLFSGETYYFNNSVYSVKTNADTSGKQFYLNKYFLKSSTENFDYKFKWQFPFERKNIRSAHIFYANKTAVFLFVNVFGGAKTGQWILKIEAETGKLVKATKINDKGENASYVFGDFLVDKNYNAIQFVGQKLAEAEILYSENRFNMPAQSTALLYSFVLDSLGEISGKQDFKMPVVDIKSTKNKKELNYYLLKLSGVSKDPEGGLSFTGDVYKGAKGNACHVYCNTVVFNLKKQDETTFVLEKVSIQPNIQLEDYYASADKLDMNGKLCLDSLVPVEQLFQRLPGFPVKQAFKTDGEKNAIWILSKHLLKNNAVNYSFLSPVKKIYQITRIEELNEASNPQFIHVSSTAFIICSQPEDGKYQLKPYNW